MRRFFLLLLLCPALARFSPAQSPPIQWQVDLAQYGYRLPTNKEAVLGFYQFATDTAVIMLEHDVIVAFPVPMQLQERPKDKNSLIPRGVRLVALDLGTGGLEWQADFSVAAGGYFLWRCEGAGFALRGPEAITIYSPEGKRLNSVPSNATSIEVSPSGQTVAAVAAINPKNLANTERYLFATSLLHPGPAKPIRAPVSSFGASDSALAFTQQRWERAADRKAHPKWHSTLTVAIAGSTAEILASEHLLRIGGFVSESRFLVSENLWPKFTWMLIDVGGGKISELHTAKNEFLFLAPGGNDEIFAMARVQQNGILEWIDILARPQAEHITIFRARDFRPIFDVALKPLPPVAAKAALSRDGRRLTVFQGTSVITYAVPEAEQKSPQQE